MDWTLLWCANQREHDPFPTHVGGFIFSEGKNTKLAYVIDLFVYVGSAYVIGVSKLSRYCVIEGQTAGMARYSAKYVLCLGSYLY